MHDQKKTPTGDEYKNKPKQGIININYLAHTKASATKKMDNIPSTVLGLWIAAPPLPPPAGTEAPRSLLCLSKTRSV